MDNRHVRKHPRLKDYDYSQAGAYFVTICVKDRHEMLGTVDVGARIARPSKIGLVVESALLQISKKYEGVSLDKYVIMPNHIHALLILTANSNDHAVNNNGRAMRAPTVSRIINQLKGYVTKQLGFSIWQKLFYDHIIRNATEYNAIWKYIDENPARWAEDEYYCRGAHCASADSQGKHR